MAETTGSIFGPINAETGDITQFTTYSVEAGETLTATTSALNNGLYGFNHYWGTTANDACYGIITFTSRYDGYFRSYINIVKSHLSLTTEASANFLCVGNSTNNLAAHMRMYQITSTAIGLRCYLNITSTLVYSAVTTNVFTSGWHYGEIYWKAGSSSDGEYKFIFDGTTLAASTAQTLTDLYINKVCVGGYGLAATTDGTIYMDDIKGSTVGTIGPYSESYNQIPMLSDYLSKMRAHNQSWLPG